MRIRTLHLLVALSVTACVEENPFLESASGDDAGGTATGSGDSSNSPASSDGADTSPGDGTITSSATADTSDGEEASETLNMCSAFQFCTSLPEGWTGFSTLTVGDACPAGFPDILDVGFTALDAPEADCDCQCAGPTSCGETATLAVRYGGTCIDAGGPTWDLVADTQVVTGDIEDVSGQDTLLLSYDAPDAASCAPQPTAALCAKKFEASEPDQFCVGGEQRVRDERDHESSRDCGEQRSTSAQPSAAYA